MAPPVLWARAEPIDYPALLALVQAGDADALRHALETRPIEHASIKGRALLMMEAAGGGHADIVKLTPLLLALGTKSSLTIVAALVERGAIRI